MTSEKQIEANRKNALRSTGPTSEEGKARSSLNRVDHGLTAQGLLLGDEEQDDYLQMRKAVFDQYRPSTDYAGLLAGRLADDFWRLARIPKFEVRMLEYQPHATEPQGEGDAAASQTTISAGELQGRSLRLWMLPSDAFGKLTRYEAAIMKKIKATVELLEGLPKAVEAAPAKLQGVPTPADAERIRRQIEASMGERYPR